MKRILIVDDDSSVRLMLGRILQAESYEVVFARDGVEGLEKAKTAHPDLIVIDVLMPNMGGISLCSFLKKDAKTADIPVIFLTGQGKIDDIEKALAEGAQAYLTKPVEYPRLIAKVEDLLRQSVKK